MKIHHLALLVSITLISTIAVAQDTNDQSWLKAPPAAVQHWQSLRYGMFIHWGPVSLTHREISWSRGTETPIEEYDNLYKKFNPVKFDADAWVSIAKAAGMKYLVFTAKHHDGFCLWDTKFTDYNIMHTPFKRDVVKELSDACKKQGIAFGAYYSVCDWHNPDWPESGARGKVPREKSDMDAYEKYLLNQTKELITKYGPLITIWNDGGHRFEPLGVDTIKMIRELQPDILINDRCGIKKGSCGDYSTPEQVLGKFNMTRPWESCMTISAHNHWAWGGPDDGVKGLTPCLLMLIRAAGGDGNVLMNVGPTEEGLIDAKQVERLKEIGAWLGKYGETIYGTRGGPYKPSKSVASTRKGNMVYIHITAWPTEKLNLPTLPAKIIKSSVLTGGTVDVKQSETGVEITVPAADRQALDTIVALELDKPAIEIEPISMPVTDQPKHPKKKK